ncbi:MAG TPA: cyclic pyranopterin monophosphate synthase MoaC [bacterium]|nr:cyclic pyranopterin monophosphate synthase MoaC [bacterium]
MKKKTSPELRMADVSEKEKNLREAVAAGVIKIKKETMTEISRGNMPKGDIFPVAKIAGINASKITSHLIPFCHNIELSNCDISFEKREKEIEVTAKVKTLNRTGVEMEAMTAVSVALLTLYDMLKPIDKSMTIENVRLLEKRGGKSGTYVRKD